MRIKTSGFCRLPAPGKKKYSPFQRMGLLDLERLGLFFKNSKKTFYFNIWLFLLTEWNDKCFLRCLKNKCDDNFTLDKNYAIFTSFR